MEEEVNKYVAAYRSTPDTMTGQTPNVLMFNREIDTKLPLIPVKLQGKHHKEARQKDKEATKVRYDRKHRAQQQDLQIGDLVYKRNETCTTTKGPWEQDPHRIPKVVHNQITATRDETSTLRDRHTSRQRVRCWYRSAWPFRHRWHRYA